MNAGDRVIAIAEIPTGIFSAVKKGTQGTCVAVKGFWGGDRDISFDDGNRITVSADKVRAI